VTYDDSRYLTLHSAGANRNGRVYLPSAVVQFFPHIRHEGERFALFDNFKEREVVRPTFLEANYDELLRLAQLVNFPWSDEARKLMDTPPMEDAELTAEDTKELDEFLSSFSRT